MATNDAGSENEQIGPVEADEILPGSDERQRDDAGRFVAKEEAAEPEVDARPESKREAILRSIQERRRKQSAEQSGDEIVIPDASAVPNIGQQSEAGQLEAEVDAGDAELQPDTASSAEPVAPAKRKIKVDGQIIEVSEDELIRIAQQNLAADRRLADSKRDREEAARERAEAARLLEFARNGGRGNQPEAEESEAERNAAADAEKRQRLAALREQLMFGSEEDGIEALEEIQRMSQPNQTREEPDIYGVVNEALAARQRQEATTRALTTFAENHPDLVSDPMAMALVNHGFVEGMRQDMLVFPDVREESIRALTPLQLAEAHRRLRENGFQVRDLGELMESAATSTRAYRGQSAQPKTEQRPMASREDRKRELQPQPRSAGIRVEPGSANQKPQSRSDVIRAMGNRTKGVPVTQRY